MNGSFIFDILSCIAIGITTACLSSAIAVINKNRKISKEIRDLVELEKRLHKQQVELEKMRMEVQKYEMEYSMIKEIDETNRILKKQIDSLFEQHKKTK